MPLEMLWVLRVGCECPGSDHCSAQHKEAEVARLEQRVAVLAGRVQELSTPGATDSVPALKKQLWDLEGSAAEQRKELEWQTAAVDHLEQVMWGWGAGAHRAQANTILIPSGLGIIAGCFRSMRGWSWRSSG